MINIGTLVMVLLSLFKWHINLRGLSNAKAMPTEENSYTT